MRSRIMARSNSAKLPIICIIIRPAGVVVSMFSVTERNRAPCAAMRSSRWSKSLSDSGSVQKQRTLKERSGTECDIGKSCSFSAGGPARPCAMRSSPTGRDGKGGSVERTRADGITE